MVPLRAPWFPAFAQKQKTGKDGAPMVVAFHALQKQKLCQHLLSGHERLFTVVLQAGCLRRGECGVGWMPGEFIEEKGTGVCDGDIDS
jgi:hypothetical protein